MTDYTSNLNLELINFNLATWHDKAWTNYKIIDAACAMIGLTLRGAWTNSTAVSAGQIWVDGDTGTIWKCLVAHTTAASPTTFVADRIANPTYWEQINTIAAGTVGVDELNSAEYPEIRGALNVDILTGFRNKLINGNFDFWERATSQTSSGYGSDDRGYNTHAGSTKTHSQQSFTLGQTDVPGEPVYYSRTVVTTDNGASSRVIKWQKIEDVRTFANETVTVTFYAKADAAKNIAVEMFQNFGTGGSPSSEVYAGSTTCALTTSWKKFSFTVTIPSISGKTIGTNLDSYLALVFWFEAGSDWNARTNTLGNQSGTFDIARMSVVKGDATNEDDPFSPRQIQQETELCRRYYQKIYLGDVGTGHVQAVDSLRLMANLIPEMRGAPSLTLLDTSPTFIVGGTAATGSSSTISFSVLSPHGVRVIIDGFSALTVGDYAMGNIPGDVFISADSEL